MRLQNLWLTIGFLLATLVIAASLMPNPPNLADFKGSDKLEHFATYATMMFWFAQIYTRNRVRWAIALALVMLGISLECLQGLSGYRTFEYADMGANAAGVLCALLLAQTPLSKSLAVIERSLLRFIEERGRSSQEGSTAAQSGSGCWNCPPNTRWLSPGQKQKRCEMYSKR